MSLFNQVNAQGGVLRAAMRGTALRNEIISNNIANNDVPGFRARQVDFEGTLRDALGEFPHNARSRMNMNLDHVEPTVRYRNLGFHYRIDGNSVDIEVEMVKLYQNSMKFDTLVSSMMANSERMRNVLQAGRQ